MSTNYQTTLDRTQREALRREMELEASGYGDFQRAMRRCERDYMVRHLAKLGRMIAMLDAIGWTEQPEAPDEQPVRFTRRVGTFARSQAKELAEAVHEFTPQDVDLDALGALAAIGEAREAVSA